MYVNPNVNVSVVIGYVGQNTFELSGHEQSAGFGVGHETSTVLDVGHSGHEHSAGFGIGQIVGSGQTITSSSFVNPVSIPYQR